jgi:TatD DNase family protein
VIDAHAHLDDPRFADDLDAVVARAMAAGVRRILSCGEDRASSERNVALAERHPSVRCAVGVHPHRAGVWTSDVGAALADLARREVVVAIGEIGVDLSGRSAPPQVQVLAFEAQLRLARDLDLPVVVHVRDAGPLAREVIDRVAGVRGMIHCYSEGPEEVEGWIRRGFALSFAGTVTYPRSAALREAARACPGDRLLTETDAPYLAPQAHRGRRNEPALVAETLAAVALARAEAAQTVEKAVAASAECLFGDRWR